MQKLKINSKKQAGMVIIYSLLAILILSIIAASLIRSQNIATRAYNQLYDVELAKDATDFCIAEAFDVLQQLASSGMLPQCPNPQNAKCNTPQDISSNLNDYNSSKNDCSLSTGSARVVGSSSKMVCAFADIGNNGIGITNQRISNLKKISPITTCNYQYVGNGTSSSSNGEISSSRDYGVSSSTPIYYYKVTAIKDTDYARVEYEVILGI